MIVEVYSAPGRTTGDRVLGFLRAYAAAHGGATPTVFDIKMGLGLTTHAVAAALDTLAQARRICWRSGSQDPKRHHIYLVEDVAGHASQVESEFTDVWHTAH